MDDLIKMAVIHYQFEAIHPFFDDNGRVGRILMVLYLVLSKNLRYPALFLSGYINAQRKDYYRLLRGVTYQGRWVEWVEFIVEGVREQATKTGELIEKILQLKLKIKTEAIDKLDLTYADSLVNYLFRGVFYTQAKLVGETQIKTLKTARVYLELLGERGFLQTRELEGSKEKIYYQEELLKLLAE